MEKGFVEKEGHGYNVVAVDFDGTIATYDNWKGPGVFGPPLPGAKEALDRLMLMGWTIIINTTRGVDIKQVEEYLAKHRIPFNHINCNHPDAPDNVSDKKVLASVYIDDRALQFDGRWEGMVERVEGFAPWYKRENKRPSLNLTVAGYHVDQISLYVDSIAKSCQEYDSVGHDRWVLDVVRAEVVKLPGSKPNDVWGVGSQFTVGLAFNYTIFPCEFELIEVLQGRTVQIPEVVTGPGLSHYGFHVNDIPKAIKSFERCGYPMLSHVRTMDHTGCPYHYEYVFMDTRRLGFISKLIKRIEE